MELPSGKDSISHFEVEGTLPWGSGDSCSYARACVAGGNHNFVEKVALPKSTHSNDKDLAGSQKEAPCFACSVHHSVVTLLVTYPDEVFAAVVSTSLAFVADHKGAFEG